jgi:tetratricopeptide (TPR) repeat protein
MAIEGPLKELGIHDVFQLLDLSQKTGVLRITSRLRHNQGTVYFDGGAIVYADIQSNPHRLGEVLVRSGKIAEADLTRAREMQQAGDGRRLGEVLVEIGAIAPRDLERQVRRQIEEVVFELMSWHEGYFSFGEGPLPALADEAAVRLPTEALLMEGARRIDEWSRIEAKIPNLDVVPAFSAGEDASEGLLDLLPSEWEVLAAIDGERSVRAIAAMLGRSEFEVAKTVFGLSTAAVVSIVDRRRGAAGELARMQDIEELVSRVEGALGAGDAAGARAAAAAAAEKSPHEASIHLLLGRVALATGYESEAEEHLRRALKLDAMLAAAHRLLGNTLALQGRFAEAVEWWQRWLKIAAYEPRLGVDVDAVQEAVQAAQTLELLLRGPRG